MAKAETTTPTREITIQGLTFPVLQPYAEGHVCTEAEAKALNQVRAENIRNNMAVKIKKGEAGAEEVAAYDAEYQFTLASVGGGRAAMTPVEKEARNIARLYLSKMLKEQGITQKAYKDANGEDSISEKVAEFSAHPQIVKMAEKAVAEREANSKVAGELTL